MHADSCTGQYKVNLSSTAGTVVGRTSLAKEWSFIYAAC